MSKNAAMEALLGSGSVQFNDGLGAFVVTTTDGEEGAIRLDYGDVVEDYTITLEEK